MSETTRTRYMNFHGTSSDVETKRFDLQKDNYWILDFNYYDKTIFCSRQYIYTVLKTCYGLEYAEANVLLLQFFNTLFGMDFITVKKWLE
jgi:hypothetical protein